MKGAFGSGSRSGRRGPRSGVASRDTGLRLLASFPDLERPATDPPASIAPEVDGDSHSRKPRIGWGSIAILAVVAVAACTAAWWIDRGPIDPGAAEIERVRIAQREAGNAAPPLRTTMKIKKSTNR